MCSSVCFRVSVILLRVTSYKDCVSALREVPALLSILKTEETSFSFSTLCLFQFCVIARQTACVYPSIKAITRTYLCTWILCFTWQNNPTKMDPAKEGPFRSAVELQGAMLGKHEEELSASRHAVESLTAQVSDLSAQLLHLRHESSSQNRLHSSEPRINNPPCYAGEPTECRAFLTQCEVVFSLQPQTYAADRARIAYVVSLLTGRARGWATAAWEAQASCCGHYELFKGEMIKVFDRSVHGREASRLLAVLHQGERSVADFAIEFRTLATTCEWNEPALVARFLEGLNIDLREEIYAREPPAQFDQLVELAIRLERCFEQRRRVRGSVSRQREAPPSAFDSSVSRPEPEPMQLGGIRLSPTERQRRIINRLCLYCGAAGHFASSCLLKARARQ